MRNTEILRRKNDAIKNREQKILAITQELNDLEHRPLYRRIKTRYRQTLKNAINRLTEEQRKYQQDIWDIEKTEQERKNWTVCHYCDCIDTSGGCTCPNCGQAMETYQTLEQS